MNYAILYIIMYTLLSSLKHTSIVLVDHEEALKKKLQHKIEEVELERYATVIKHN